ncbi:MAG: hypothetical protein WCP18_02135 [bacterium]
MLKQRGYLVSLISFPFLIWILFAFIGNGRYLFNFSFILDPIALIFFFIKGLPVVLLILLGCSLFAIFVAKKTSQSIKKSIAIILCALIITPIALIPIFSLVRIMAHQIGLQTNNQYFCQLEAELSTSYENDQSSNECLFKLALNNNNASVCESMGSGDLKLDCYKNLAFKNNDSSICGKLVELSVGEGAEYWIGGAKIVNDCYEEMAIKNNDPSLCDKMRDGLYAEGVKAEDYKIECLSKIK